MARRSSGGAAGRLAEGRTDEVLRDVAKAPVAVLALVLAPRDVGRIAAASQAAMELLGYGESLVGRYAADLAIDRPTGVLDLLRRSRLTSFETTVSLASSSGDPVETRVWVRAVESKPPVRHALVLLLPIGQVRLDIPMPDSEVPRDVQVIGSADADLVVDRVSAEIEQLTGSRPQAILQQSLLRLVADEDVGTVLLALGQVASSGRGASVTVRLRTSEGGYRIVECVLVPLQPPPSVAFALGASPTDSGSMNVNSVDRMVARFRHVVAGAETSQQVSRRFDPSVDVSMLSTRELEIVQRLLEGDRVPAIAKAMTTSQSTVRSHLSSVFAKLGVASQQELITKLRHKK